MNWDNIDAEMTPWRTRVKNLQAQLGIGASKGCFDCDHFKCCHASISNQPILKGDWTYVGPKYGQALVGGKPAKILFISLDRGGQGNGYEKFKATQQGFRTAAYKRENSHMGGVDVELDHLLDETSPEDRCQQFALTNSVRCRRKSGSMRYEATRIMEQNCESHTKAIIQELEPDIIIAQGDNPRKSMCRLFSPMIVTRYRGQASAEIGRGNIGSGADVLFLLTAHPAFYARRGFPWSEGDPPPEEIEQAIQQAREIYSGVRQTHSIEENNVSYQANSSHYRQRDLFFNTNQTNAPGAYQNMFDQGVIAVYGYANGPAIFNRCTAGQRVFAYVNGMGILAVGHIVNGQAFSSDTVFGQPNEYHVRVKWETIVPDHMGVTLQEVEQQFGYRLPIRNTLCQMYCPPNITDWIAGELLHRARGNPP